MNYQERFKHAFESSNVGKSITLINGEINVNQAFCDLLGYTPEELKHKRWQELTPEEEVESVQEKLGALLKGSQTSARFNKRYIHKNGSFIWADVHVAVQLNSNRQPLYFITTIVDITRQKMAERELLLSEARFRSTFDQSPVGSVIVGLDKRFIRCNAAFCNFLGYPENELIGKTFLQFTHPDDAESGIKELKQMADGEIDIARFQKRYIRKDGKVVWGEISICLVRDSENKPLYFLPIIQDITQTKLIENEIRESEARLRLLNAEKDKFFSIIAHDLKSPFSAIVGFSNLLVDQVSKKDYDGIQEYAETILKSSERALDLLLNLMEWSRSQSGRMNFNPGNFEIAHVIHEIATLFDDIASQKSITIKRELTPDIYIFADRSMIETILRNLISNAIKFTNSDGMIFISVEKNHAQLTVSVMDNGIGIPKNTIGRLFSFNENFSNPGTMKEKGTGLGLILCKEFVEKHGGKIWVESEEGKGSTFKFSIPLAG